MSAAKHTPGPWFTAGQYIRKATSFDTKGNPVGSFAFARVIERDFCEDGDTFANARLIAAAPDIAEKAREFTLIVERFLRGDVHESDMEHAMHALRALISEATGGGRMSPSTFAALRNDAIARQTGATLPELYWSPRPVANGLKTCRGIVIGGAIAPAKAEIGSHAEHVQAALLEPRTAKPLPLLQRIVAAVWRWC